MARISEEAVKDIRQKADIVEIVKHYIPLTPKGKNYVGLCPFHQDHSPSMSVSKEKQIFKCFSCGASGNVFNFVSDYENISYGEAIVKVAEEIGISVSLGNQYQGVKAYQKEYDIMNLANLFYQNNLNTEYGNEPKQYLKSRGLSLDMQKEFGIGLSLGNSSLKKFLNQKKITDQELLDLSLASQGEQGIHDLFMYRITFPIHNDKGDCVGFTARVYEKDKSPKYLNSRETKIFKKGHIFFNYHRAKDTIRMTKKMIIVEGNMDAIRMYGSGFKNTVALMGTSITSNQIELIRKSRANVVTLMLDNDEAGESATLTNGDILMSEGINTNVVRLSHEKDPDEYILKNGISAMQNNLDHPLTYIAFKLQALKKNRNLDDAGELALYVKDVLKSLQKSDSITIEVALNELVKTYHLSYDVLKSELGVTEKTQDALPANALANILPKQKENRYLVSVQHILYDMMNDYEYIKIFENRLSYFKEELYRSIASEIIYYANQKKEISLADFLSYAEESPLKDEIYKVIKSIKEPEIAENSIYDYINVVKISMWKEEIKKLKQEQRETLDQNKKEEIAVKILDYNKKIQEIKKERSV